MTHDLETLTATLLANHITVRFPRISTPAHETGRKYPPPPPRMLLWLHRAGIRMALAVEGHRQVIDHINRGPDGCWCIHFFSSDASALPLIANVSQGVISPGDVVGFDAKAFVEDRLYCLGGCDRLMGRDPWWEGHQRYFIRSC